MSCGSIIICALHSRLANSPAIRSVSCRAAASPRSACRNRSSMDERFSGCREDGVPLSSARCTRCRIADGYSIASKQPVLPQRQRSVQAKSTVV